MNLLLFIHGYNSSSLSIKARQTDAWLQKNAPDWQFSCPNLSPFPVEAVDQLKTIIDAADDGPVGLVGSSMGGFYATWLVEKYGLKAVLINPAVEPHRSMSRYLGENANYHTGETFVLEPHHMGDFLALDIETLKDPRQYRVLLQTGDEVLDYRQAEKKYKDCHLVVEQGGDHNFQNYTQHLPAIVSFLRKA